MLLWNVGLHTHYTMLYPRRRQYSNLLQSNMCIWLYRSSGG
jgi:hypothetical protein